MNVRTWMVGVAVLGTVALASAQEKGIKIEGGDTVKSVLERHPGKTVTVRLHGGEELSGKVTKVGDEVVHLAELTGRDFYDAIVPLDHIDAVILRAR